MEDLIISETFPSEENSEYELHIDIPYRKFIQKLKNQESVRLHTKYSPHHHTFNIYIDGKLQPIDVYPVIDADDDKKFNEFFQVQNPKHRKRPSISHLIPFLTKRFYILSQII